MRQPLRVLVAEDDLVGAALLKGLLARDGHELLGPVVTGEEAVRVAGVERPDAVLMDIWLAGTMNGVQAARIISSDYDIPVIFVTGATDDDPVVNEVIHSGALGFLPKPVTGDALRVNLRMVRHHHHLAGRLRASEQRYRAIFDNAVVGIYVATPEGRYLASNRAFADMLGWDGPGDLVTGVRCMDTQVYEETGRRQELLDRLHADRTVTEFVSRVYGRDGDLLWVSEHCTALRDETGRLHSYEGIVVDVSARIEAEQRWRTTHGILRATMDAMSDFVVLLDLDRNVIMTNAAWGRHAGTGVPGASGSDAADPWYGPQACCPDMIVPDGGATPLDRFLSVGGRHSAVVRLLPGGEECLCSVSPYCSPEGAVVGVVLVLHPLAGAVLGVPGRSWGGVSEGMFGTAPGGRQASGLAGVPGRIAHGSGGNGGGNGGMPGMER